MSLRKVYGGTPVGNESRCDTCANARIIQGYSESERIVICVGLFDEFRVSFKVMQCTMYEDRRLPDFDAAKIDPSPICSLSCSDALLGIIDAVDFSLCGRRCQLANRSAASATYIEDRVVALYRDVR